MNTNPLDKQTVVITGAAGGIGFAIVERLSNLGVNVIAITRSNVENLQQRLDQLPGSHCAVLGNVVNTSSIQAIADQLDNCDMLINCAGISKTIPHKNLEDLTDEFFDEILTVNLRSTFSVIRTFTPLLKKSQNGLIINISSTSAIKPGVGSNIAYTAAKAGIENMTKNLALVLAPEIRVVSVCPGAVDTEFLDLSNDTYNRIADATPLKRIATPKDIALAVEAIATLMKFTTGNCFVIDGGKML
jgi:3-oxoacyl-[acyl-carrier protein] reductase